MVLKFIGNGSCFNVSRGNNCAYYREGDKILFLDFGENIFERVVKSDIMKGVKEVFIAITHLHSDHVGSLPSLIFYCKYKLKVRPQLVSGGRNKDTALMDFLAMGGVSPDLYGFCGINLNNGMNVYGFRKLKSCKFMKVSHCKPIGQAYAIKLEMKDGQQIFYSGDTNDENFVRKVMGSLNEGDEFYCDCCALDYFDNAHMNIDVLKKLVPEEKRKQVYCMHIDDDALIPKIKKLGFKMSVRFDEKDDEDVKD